MSQLRRFLRNWQNLLALLLIGGCLCVALAAPWLTPQEDPANPTALRMLSGYRPTALRVPRPPSAEAPLGTVPGGWDVYHALVWGTRPALHFGLITTVLTAGFGVIVGTAQPTTSVTAQPTTSVTAQPTTSVTAQPTTSVTAQPTTSVTAQPTTRV